MILFAELNKTGKEHTVVNGCMLEILNNIFKDDIVDFWGSKAHFERLSPRPASRIVAHFVTVLEPRDGDKLFWLYKFFRETRLIIQAVRHARREKARLLFFSSMSVFGNLAASRLAAVCKSVPIIITLHGELAYVRRGDESSRSEKLFGAVLKRALTYRSSGVKYLVLGPSIKDNLAKLGIIAPQRLIAIPHPYIFPGIPKSVDGEAPSFGHVGIALRSKHSDKFFRLAERFEEEIRAGKVSFKMVGRVWTEMDGLTNSLVEYADTDTFLTRQTYEQRLAEIDYAVFFYGDEQYTLTGSGAIMDAIALEKPILCLRSQYLEHLFAQAPGAPGWIFDDFDGLVSKVRDIIDGKDTDGYAEMARQMAFLKTGFSIEYVERQLAPQLAYLFSPIKVERARSQI